MKGIILAGGSGTRLHPLTLSVSKQILPIYDKPMIYYPLSTLMLAGIKDILIISTPHDINNFKNLFGDGHNLGLTISYAVQSSPDGLAQSFIIGENFICDDDVCLILGDNIIYGAGLQKFLKESVNQVKSSGNATILGYYVDNPNEYGIAELDETNNVLSLEEKPKDPKSNCAIIGLYFYPNSVINIAKNVKPSERGELEITSVNQEYLKQNKLNINILSRGYAWLDAGTHESMYNATEFVKSIERRTGLKISCIEEVAYRMGYIDKNQLSSHIKKLEKSTYGQYLKKLLI